MGGGREFTGTAFRLHHGARAPVLSPVVAMRRASSLTRISAMVVINCQCSAGRSPLPPVADLTLWWNSLIHMTPASVRGQTLSIMGGSNSFGRFDMGKGIPELPGVEDEKLRQTGTKTLQQKANGTAAIPVL